MPTPSSAVRPALARVVNLWLDVSQAYVASVAGPDTTSHPMSAMSTVLYLRSKQPNTLEESERKFLANFTARSFPEEIGDAVHLLWGSDPHLQQTCRSDWEMARALEIIWLDHYADMLGSDSQLLPGRTYS